MRFLPVVSFALLIPFSAHASWTGNDLLRLCRKEDSAKLACINYIDGVLGGLSMAWMSGGPNLYCAPDQVILDQDIDITVKYLEKHPERRHIYGPRLIVEALSEAFPCPKD